jgi:hypothetical protein
MGDTPNPYSAEWTISKEVLELMNRQIEFTLPNVEFRPPHIPCPAESMFARLARQIAQFES